MQTKDNKMGIVPVNKLLISMSLPMIASMLIQALYNIVDSIFVAQLSENALTAVSLAFPAQNLMVAVGVGTGVGVNALISRNLGERNFEKANKIAENGVFLNAINFIIFLVFGLFFVRFYYVAQTSTAEIIQDGIIYLSICTICSFGLFIQLMYEKLLQSTGKTLYSMYAQGVGAIINIILDPILIFGYFGMPRMEIAGAAVATVVGQIASAVVAMCLNKYKNHELNLSFKNFRPNTELIKEIYAIGIPSIIMASIGSVMTFFFNKILTTFNDTAAAILGVYFKLQSIIFMPVFGLNNGMVPIIGYNYGAKKRSRMMKALLLSISYAVGLMLLGLIIMQVFPVQMFKMFNASEQMLSDGIPALRIISLSFIFAGYCIITSSFFQALGHGVFSMFTSFIRQIIVLLPVAYLLSLTGKLEFVWWAFPIAEVVAVIICTLFLIKIYKSVIKGMPFEK